MFRGSTRTRRPPRLASLDSSKERNVPHPWDRKVCRAIGSKEALSCENDRQAFNFPFPPLYCFSPWLRFPVNSRSFFNASPFQFFSSFCRRGVAQLGSAPALGAGGRRFKSCRPDHIPHSSDIFVSTAIKWRSRHIMAAEFPASKIKSSSSSFMN